MSALRVQFVHGLEGSPQGAKARLLAEHFDARTPPMDTSDFEGCVATQAAVIDEFRPQLLVGSSFGGAVAVALLQRARWSGPTLLLAQAALRRGLEATLPANAHVWLVHGRHDDVIDPDDSRRLAAAGSPEHVRLLEVDDDHALHGSVRSGALLDWVRDLARHAGLLVLVALLAMGCGSDPGQPEGRPPGERSILSILALGDTGKEPLLGLTPPGQRAVAQALTLAHRRAPADLLILLGDNFYDTGLHADELEERIAANVVAPYCAFVALEGDCSDAVADACSLPTAERRPVPILVLLGNHDYQSEESPGLQRDRVPCYVSNWRVPPGPVERVELDAGLSLIFYDSYTLHEERAYDRLVAELRAARGPWRVLVAHGPLRDNAAGLVLAKVLRSSGVTVHAHLAGHEHNLQIARPLGDRAPLQVVAGGGSESRDVKVPLLGAEFAAIAMGFARLDVVETSEGQRLDARLFEAPAMPFEALSEPRLLGTWSVFEDGRIEAGPVAR